jgi:ribosomal protein S18 acetylase RimI-like enzyme
VIRPDVRRAHEDDIDAVGALIAVSFNDLDADAVDHGRVDVIPDGDGLLAAAVWFDRTRDLPEVARYERRLADLAASYPDRFSAIHALVDEHHPHQPHWQLALLGVHPRCQNMGLGSALLKHRDDEMDTVGLSQYVEASNRNSVRLYRRHGYHEIIHANSDVLTGHRSSGCGAPPTRRAV